MFYYRNVVFSNVNSFCRGNLNNILDTKNHVSTEANIQNNPIKQRILEKVKIILN